MFEIGPFRYEWCNEEDSIIMLETIEHNRPYVMNRNFDRLQNTKPIFSSHTERKVLNCYTKLTNFSTIQWIWSFATIYQNCLLINGTEIHRFSFSTKSCKGSNSRPTEVRSDWWQRSWLHRNLESCQIRYSWWRKSRFLRNCPIWSDIFAKFYFAVRLIQKEAISPIYSKRSNYFTLKRIIAHFVKLL